MDTWRDCTSGKELPGSFSISRECSRHYCETVVSLFSDVSHARWKDDKPVLMFILNEPEWSSAVLRSVPVKKKCTDIFWWMTNAMNFPTMGYIFKLNTCASIQSTFDVSEMFVWLQFSVLADPVKNIQSCSPIPLEFSWLCVQSLPCWMKNLQPDLEDKGLKAHSI